MHCNHAKGAFRLCFCKLRLASVIASVLQAASSLSAPGVLAFTSHPSAPVTTPIGLRRSLCRPAVAQKNAALTMTKFLLTTAFVAAVLTLLSGGRR